MADDLDLEEVEETPQDEEKPPEAPDQSANYWKSRAEKAERRWKRTQELQKLQGKYPGVSEEDLQGVDIRHWERIAARIAPPQAPTEEPEPVEKVQERAAVAQFTQAPVGSTPAGSAKISFEDARKLSWPERRELIRLGKVEGVEAPPVA